MCCEVLPGIQTAKRNQLVRETLLLIMNIQDSHEYFEENLDFPLVTGAVNEQIGSTEIDAPDEEDSRTISELLSQADEETYNSANDLYEMVVSSLPDDYIGRKYYDDRGSNLEGLDAGPSDDKDTSF